MADALATLASMWDNPKDVTMKLLVMCRVIISCYQGERVMIINGPKEKSWFYDILKFLEKRDDGLPQVYGIIEVINSGYEVDSQGQVV